MTTLAKFNSFPQLRSLMEDFWNPETFFSNSIGVDQMVPAVNIKDTKEGFKMELVAPGFKKEDFKIETENGMLSISGETNTENNKDDEHYSRREFSMSSFKRTFRLPQDISEKDVSANYRDGILVLDIKSTAKKLAPKKQIAIH